MTKPLDVVPVYLPYLGAEIKQAAADALEDGWLGIGPLTERFEKELESYLELTEGRRVVSTSSCTAALHLATILAGAGPGDEVICPAFTYVAGHQAVSATGAEVVFCDIEEQTWGADPASIESMITERTKAVMAVHYAGVPCDLDGIYALAGKYGLRVIEDAAHAFGSRHQGKRIGSIGDLVCFSFGPVKAITTMEGGAIVTPNPDDVQRLHELRLIGVTADTNARYQRGRMWDYDVVRQGYRYHLGSVPAAIGLSQLPLAETFAANRRSYCRTYDEQLAGVSGVNAMATDWTDVVPYIYVLRLDDGVDRADFMAHLKARGVASGIHFNGGHHYSFYEKNPRADMSVTDRVSSQVVTLPLHPFMDEETLSRVTAAVRSYFAA